MNANTKSHFIFQMTKQVLVLIIVALISQHANASSYITFNDGHLLVFPDSCISSITTNNGVVTFTDRNGGKYSYSLDVISSIDNQLTKNLPMITSYKFDDKYNYQLVSDAIGIIGDDEINIEVSGIGKRLTASFDLSATDARVYVDGIQQVSAESRMRFENSKKYTAGYPGDMILTLKEDRYAMIPFGRDYNVIADFLTDHSTSVPRIDINTVGGVNITSKVDYVDAEIIIDGAGVFPSMTDSVKIRGRGNTSWSPNPAAKNPYRLKFARKVKPLGLTKGKNWVLLANNQYGSMMTNAIGMKAASLIGTPAANHIIPVDLYINGTYKGNYNFTEKVGFSNNSIDLDDESVATLLELDTYYDEAEGQKFKSNPYNIPVNIKYPEFNEDSTSLTLNLIQSRFNYFTSAVNQGSDLADVVDISCLARYMMVNELILNKEIFHPKSTYCYYENLLDDDSKLIFGPEWDLDWAFGYNGTASSYFNKRIDYDYFNTQSSGAQYEFMKVLGQNEKVSRRMYELWRVFIKDDLDELCEFCLDYYDYAKPSLEKSITAYADGTDYEQQSKKAVNWLRQRATLIYNKMVQIHRPVGDVNDDGVVSIADVTSLIDCLLSGQDNISDLSISDVDNDGIVSIKDITALIDYLLGSSSKVSSIRVSPQEELHMNLSNTDLEYAQSALVENE